MSYRINELKQRSRNYRRSEEIKEEATGESQEEVGELKRRKRN